ncbi:MAG TPA: LysR family transcriptional regulator [Solirubrobacteraceae bacterium]|nr:LysR family transcriptional regulator [Solirubrobacteraceae bacterium]
MTLQQLQYFLSAIQHGSFSAAADALHLAQPSLSEQIRRLEAELGSPLFSRGGRGLELTEAGRRLRPHAERVLAAVDEAQSSVRQISAIEGGTLSFGMFGNAPYYLLSDLVQDFKARHPSVHMRLTGLNSSTVADAVREGRLEAGLIVLPIDDRGLEVRTVAQDEIVFMSRDPDRLREPMTIERLVQAPLILYDARYGWDDPTRQQLLRRAQQAGVTLEPDIEVEYVEAALELAARGLGDTVAARAIGVGRGFARRVGTVSFDPPLYDAFAFIYRRNAHLSPATRAFMALAERRITGLVSSLRDRAA